MFCAKCGTSIPDTAAHCPQCGASTAAPPIAPPPSSAAAPPTPARQSVPQPQRYSGPQQTDGKAVTSLILGVLALFPFGVLTGIPAVILGHLSKSSIAKSLGRLKGDGMATAGLIMGYASIAFIPIILIIAAIAIPNLIRARQAANESAAVSTLRDVNTAQISYSTTYGKGYAPDLATMGPGSDGSCSTAGYASQSHACLLDGALAGPTCTADSWCAKGGYRFNATATCGSDGACSDFVVTALPITPGTTGQRSFCSTSDGVLRFRRRRGAMGAIATPLTVEACQSWPPI